MASAQFNSQLTIMFPRLRGWALTLTRNSATADDLVQDVVLKAIQGHASFIPGTNFRAWLRRIMMNHFISIVRARREFVDLDEVAEVALPCSQEHTISLKRLNAKFIQLPIEQREAIQWIAIDNRSYEEASEIAGVAIGTLKSRVHRARHVLRSEIEGVAA